MQKRLGTLFLCITAVMALFAMSAMPALAGDDNKGQGKKEEKAQNYQQADQQASSQASDNDGDADSDSSTAYDEDTDTNDGTANNVEDDGDNAHPSGKDRSVENGKSNNQGKAESNPDDSKGPQRYEGAKGDDKPNGPGGTDLADQDGNNGCGNDDDFDDDNNGHCGPRKPAPSPSPTSTSTCPDGSPMPSSGKCDEVKSDDDVKGGTASMTIEVDCYSVTVTSTKDISNVKVYFVDGTMVEINVNSPSFSQTFTKPIDYATSKSATTTVVDTAPENCTQVGGSGDDLCPSNPNMPAGHPDCVPPVVCPVGTDMAGNVPGPTGCDIPRSSVCPAGTEMAGLPPGVHGCNLDNEFIVCPEGTDFAGLAMNDLEDCDEDDVLGRTDEANPVKYCPAGPFEGMPMLDDEDCDSAAGGIRDRVLPKVIHNEANPLADVAGRVVGAVGAVLPFTGAGDAYFAAALGLLLIAAGAVSLKLRKES